MLVEIVGKRYEEKLLTTSRKIAESFEKEHKEVIRAIGKYEPYGSITDGNIGAFE